MDKTVNLVIGTAIDFPFQRLNLDGSPMTSFLGSDILAAVVWQGDNQAVLLAPATTWLNAALAQFQVSFQNTDTASWSEGSYRLQVTASRGGRSASILDAGLEITGAPGSTILTRPPDLITQDYLWSCLGTMRLKTSQVTLLPQLVRAASRMVRRHCHRYFTRAVHDDLYTMSNPPSHELQLREFPVNQVLRCASGPTTALAISNDNVANSRALAMLSTTGNADTGLVVTGLQLQAIASAVVTTTPLLFATYPTVATLGAAVNALGASWNASLTSGLTGWATSDLRFIQGNTGCLAPQAAGFVIHIDDLPFLIENELGIITLGDSSVQAWNDPWLWPTFAEDTVSARLYGGFNGVRVTYDAGFDVVPEDVQQGAVELVKAMLERLRTDTTLSSETAGKVSYMAESSRILPAVPYSVQQMLAPWVIRRA